MQSTTRWCLNEASMSSCTFDQNGVFHMEHKPLFVPNRAIGQVNLQVNSVLRLPSHWLRVTCSSQENGITGKL